MGLMKEAVMGAEKDVSRAIMMGNWLVAPKAKWTGTQSAALKAEWKAAMSALGTRVGSLELLSMSLCRPQLALDCRSFGHLRACSPEKKLVSPQKAVFETAPQMASTRHLG